MRIYLYRFACDRTAMRRLWWPHSTVTGEGQPEVGPGDNISELEVFCQIGRRGDGGEWRDYGVQVCSVHSRKQCKMPLI